MQLALTFLRLHGWWEGVAPRLPPRLATAVTEALFTLPGARLGLDSRAAGLPGACWRCTAPASAPLTCCLHPPRRADPGATPSAAPAERHPSLTGRRGLWARARRLLTLDFVFDSLDELFEAGDNVDLTVGW